MRQLIRTYSITGQHEITITDYTFTKQDIRLIINETLASNATSDSLLIASVLASSTKKANVVSVINGVITLANTTPNLTAGDILTIEIDVDNVAKQGSNPEATNTAIYNDVSALTQLFDIVLPQGYDWIDEEEVTSTLEEIMQIIDPELTAALAAEITAETEEIINPIES